MDLSTRVLGSKVADDLGKRATAVLLRIGSDTFDRMTLSQVACFNFTAAANLSAILNRELHVKNTRDVFERISPLSLALPRLGAVSLAVLGAAFEAKHVGGDTPLVAWVQRHADEKHKEVVTWGSLKARGEADSKAERDRAKARKGARTNKAHELRVERHVKRAGNGASV